MITNNEMHNIIHKFIDREEVEDRRRSATFLIWFLTNIFHLDKDISISCICDEENDKGIDAIYVDHIEEEIHIFQSKLKTKFPSDIGDKCLRDFEGINVWFNSSEKVNNLLSSKINNELKSLINENNLIDLVNDYKVKYNFIINSKRDLNTIEYLKVNNNIDVWCIDLIRESFHEIKFDPFVNDTFTFNSLPIEQSISIDDKKMIVVPLLASDLVRLKGIDDMTLFHSNVRFGLGKTRVNKSIVKTLKNQDEKNNFLMFHNGISIVCSNYTYENNVLSITDYSIVNGAQSTLTLYQNSGILDENIKIMAKIIKTGENENLSDLITYYSNNQNSISMRDLRSNDTIQRRLISQFSSLDERFNIKITYVPKRGQFVPDDHFELNSDYAAQLITTCSLKKPYETHLKTAMFDSKYIDIFNKNINASKLYMYYRIHELIKENLKYIDSQKIATYGLAQFCILNIIITILESHEETCDLLVDQNKYFLDKILFDDFLTSLFTSISNVFNYLISEYESDETIDFEYKNFFKNKDSVTKLSSNTISQFNSTLQITRTSYTQFYNNIFNA
jgi:hypothetical protein